MNTEDLTETHTIKDLFLTTWTPRRKLVFIILLNNVSDFKLLKHIPHCVDLRGLKGWAILLAYSHS